MGNDEAGMTNVERTELSDYKMILKKIIQCFCCLCKQWLPNDINEDNPRFLLSLQTSKVDISFAWDED